jgi:hypothetical protein
VIRPPGEEAALEALLVLRTLAAPRRRRLQERRGRRLEAADPEPVSTTRATMVRPEPFAGPAEAERWLRGLRRDRRAAAREREGAIQRLNRAIQAYRVARSDPYVREVGEGNALVWRVGYGRGEEVADGRFEEAWEMPARGRRIRRSMETPEERFAGILGGRERALPGEELVLRARADLDAGRTREAALQARIALESLLADLDDAGALALEPHRAAIAAAANAALRGELGLQPERALAAAVADMERELRRRRLGRCR